MPRNPMQLESPVKVTLSFTESCNLDCRHCYADCTRTASPREMTAAEWIALVDDLFAQGVIALYIEGGEPLHRPDFLDVLRHCRGKCLVLLRTNGTLVTRELAQELKALGVATVMVDLMGATAATHDYFTGAPGSHARACAAVEALLEAGLETQILTILNRRNADEIQDILALADGLGVRTVGILRLYPIGRVKRQWSELALSLDEMMQALAALRPPPGMHMMQSWHPKDANCCWQMAAVNAYGDSIGCSYLREFVNYGKVREVGFAATWRHPLYQRLRAGEVEKSCTSCSSSQGSHGGCRSTAYAFSGRWEAPDPFDLALNEGVDLRVLPDWLLSAKPRPPSASGP
jgi:radical SAM protein with 4Fe4S-binding SPASM domain